MQPLAHDLFQGALAARQQSYGNLPLVASGAIAADVAVRLKAIDQTYGTMMPDKQALCEMSNGRLVLSRKCADGKKHLVLLRFKAGRFRSVITTPKEMTDTIAQLRQCGVFGIADSPSHVLSVS